MLKGFEDFKKTANEPERVYKEVEYKLQHGQEPTLPEVRLWFIYSTEKYYNTKLLQTQIHYCFKSFNKVKAKFNLCNFELCNKLIEWRDNYHKLGYQLGNSKFDFSCLNTDWLMDNINDKVPNFDKGKTTYINTNSNNISTKNRRI